MYTKEGFEAAISYLKETRLNNTDTLTTGDLTQFFQAGAKWATDKLSQPSPPKDFGPMSLGASTQLLNDSMGRVVLPLNSLSQMTQEQLSELAFQTIKASGFKDGDYQEARDLEEVYEQGFRKALLEVREHLIQVTELSQAGFDLFFLDPLNLPLID